MQAAEAALEPSKPPGARTDSKHDPISSPRLLRWAWYIVRGSLGLFALATLVQLLAPLATQ